jgi:hypothetical protein
MPTMARGNFSGSAEDLSSPSASFFLLNPGSAPEETFSLPSVPQVLWSLVPAARLHVHSSNGDRHNIAVMRATPM